MGFSRQEYWSGLPLPSPVNHILAVMYGCESWTIKKAECQRIDAFELWCWIRLLRVPWTARRSNQSIIKEISPEYSLEGVMLKLKFQFFGYLMQRADSLGKTRCWDRLKGMTEDEMAGWHHQLNGHEFEQASRVGDGQGRLMCCSPWGHKESVMTEQLNWTEQKLCSYSGFNETKSSLSTTKHAW